MVFSSDDNLEWCSIANLFYISFALFFFSYLFGMEMAGSVRSGFLLLYLIGSNEMMLDTLDRDGLMVWVGKSQLARDLGVMMVI